MTNRPLLNLLEWMCRTTQLPDGARTVQFASLSFDVSFQDMFSTWLSGGTLVLINEAERQDIPALARVLTQRRVNRIFIPAVALQQLAQRVEESIRSTGCAEVPSHEVGLAILGPLRELDEVAYLRFASVYRSFSSIEDFEKEIADLRSAVGDADAR